MTIYYNHVIFLEGSSPQDSLHPPSRGDPLLFHKEADPCPPYAQLTHFHCSATCIMHLFPFVEADSVSFMYVFCYADPLPLHSCRRGS